MTTRPFWPGGGKQLNVEFGADSNGTCNVWGIDPDNDNKVVFNGTVRTAQQDWFIEAVRTGQQGTPVSNENEYLVPIAPVATTPTVQALVTTSTAPIEPPDGYAVVITGGGPPPPVVPGGLISPGG